MKSRLEYIVYNDVHASEFESVLREAENEIEAANGSLDHSLVERARKLVDRARKEREYRELKKKRDAERLREMAIREREERIVHVALQEYEAQKKFARRTAAPLRSADESLVRLWLRDTGGTEASRLRLVSARAAELAAVDMYAALYGEATDISVQQLSYPNSKEWVTADIKCSDMWIDVKNARTSRLNGASTYSEHCVPKFKNNRNGNGVYICGMLSSADAGDSDVYWLGHVQLIDIARLESEFNSDVFSIDLSRNCLGKTYLPAWIFEYPDQVWRDRSAPKDIESTLLHSEDKLVVPLPVLARYCSKFLPNEIAGAAGFAKALSILCDNGLGRSLRSRVYLWVMSHFVECATRQVHFDAAGIRETLFMRRGGGFVQDAPLCVYDPLLSIWSLVELLEYVFDYIKKEVKLFQSFKLAGPNILMAREAHGSWRTLVAYCGGWVESKGKGFRCGFNPLLVGRHATCWMCRRLICPRCDSCSRQCHRALLNQAASVPNCESD